jgi:hypothetical protein
MAKHHITLVHRMRDGVKVHQRTYDARSPHHALDQLREEISRDEHLIAEQTHAHAVHVHVHRDEA